jgi:HPr kinase/phosphorylase
MTEAPESSCHATAVVLGEHGVLVLGPSGAGKSALALALLAAARGAGLFGALVGDDRIYLEASAGRLIASGAPHMAGAIERRAAGLLSVRSEPAAVVRLAVELSGAGKSWPRMPEGDDFLTIRTVPVPRLALSSSESPADQAIAVDERLGIVTQRTGPRKRISLEQCAAVHKNRRVAAPPPARDAGNLDLAF